MIRTYIPRLQYMQTIKPFIGKDIIKVIIWQRRTGKSYILYQLMDIVRASWVPEKKILYLNKEWNEREHIKNHNDLLKVAGQYTHLFIDEIQEIKDRELALRDLQAKGKHDIFITWSNADLLAWELSSKLGGRYVSFSIYPLNYSEFLSFHKREDSKESFVLFAKYGWLPYLCNIPLEEDVVSSYLSDVFDTILLKDIVKRYNIRNVDFFEKLLSFLAHNIWSIFSANSLSDFLLSQKIVLSPLVILNYLRHSLKALFLHEAQRYDIKGKKLFEIRQKYYFTDIGIRNTMVWSYKQLDIWQILENIVFNHLTSHGWTCMVGEYEWKEIDFIAQKWNQKKYIQVAYLMESKTTQQREFWAFNGIDDWWEKIVISMDEFSFPSEKWIKHIHIRDFLLDDLTK